IALYSKGLLTEAIDCFHKAIELDRTYAQAHAVLGMALLKQGRFAEAKAATRRGLDLLPENHPLRQRFALQLHQCKRLLALDDKLPVILKGEAEPADAAERIDLAQICQQHKKLYAASARFYPEAFADQPRLAQDLRTGHRYNAARAAVLAATGQGKDADKL